MTLLFPVLVFAVLTLVSASCWWLMARRPQRWARWAERENSFWLGKGLISTAMAGRIKRWETGRPLRLLLAATTVAGIIGMAVTASVLAKAAALAHRKMPALYYNPALLAKPANHPPTNLPANKTAAPATNKNVRP